MSRWRRLSRSWYPAFAAHEPLVAVMFSSSDSALLHVLGQDPDLIQRVRKAKVLLVGAGGIGCEVIKTLLLSGFTDVNLVDLDTIDVSNLNRQFLFNKTHVGQSKADVAAKVAVQRFAHSDVESISVRPDLTPIQNQKFDLDFFQSHTLVINALDNRAARSHVNRMCLAADVPLIESGSEGYVGQVYLIKKSVSQCYECEGVKQDKKTYASCTIRNTPSQPIHCIVWAKHLFSQLFGEHDVDDDVSPDISDPELEQQPPLESNGDSGPKKADSTREWAASHDYDPHLLFEKLFHTDIQYLLTMDKLWETRRKPVALSLEEVLRDDVREAGTSSAPANGNSGGLKDQRLWSLRECFEVFAESIRILKTRLGKSEDPFLVWDKDDAPALDFVTAVSNLRSFCFAIERKSRFDVKSMAGNIIPAIASTNSIVGGLIALQAIALIRKMPETRQKLSLMSKEERESVFRDACRHVYLKVVSLSAKNLVASYELCPPSASCFVCAPGTRELEIACSFAETRFVDFARDIVINKLHFVCPDIYMDGQSCMLWSKEEADEESDEERIQSESKKLSDFTLLHHNVRLKVSDLMQNQTVLITLKDEVIDPNLNDGQSFRIVVRCEGYDLKDVQTPNEPEVEQTQESVPETTEQVTLSDDEDDLVSIPQPVDSLKPRDAAVKRGSAPANGTAVPTSPKKKRVD